MFCLYKFLSFLWRGQNLLAINLPLSRVPRYISISSFNFFFSTNSSLFSLLISILASLSCLFILLKVGFFGGVVMSTISMGYLIGTLLPFLSMGEPTTTLFKMLSYFVDALVIGFLALTLSATGGEENTNFIPLKPVALVEGVSIGMGDGKGETSLCGD
jgi:hypothetical protein